MSATAEHAQPGFWRHYVFSTDHKMIGKQYILTAVVMALFATTWSVLLRLHLAWPQAQWPLLGKLFPGLFQDGVLLPERYLSLVTMHGTVMIFFVISISLVSGFGNFVIPLQIGARDMAYPFLNMLSYWTIVPACLIMLASFFAPEGAAGSGWTAYPPLSALPDAAPGSGLGQTLWLFAMALFIASFTMGGLNFVTTILNLRTRGMSMFRMPLTVWTMFIASILGILAFPALTAAAIMLLLDRLGSTSFFLPSGLVMGGTVLPHQGGTPLLFQHLFWFLGHPEVYVLVLPAIGIAFDVVAAHGRRPVFGYRTSVWALVVVAVLSMIVWGHHMFVSGMSPYVGEYFSIATVSITGPFAVLALNLVASLWRAEIRLTSAMMFALAIVAAVGIGGVGGIFLATATSDQYLHNSYFVVGHFHLMIAVVTFFAIFAGIYHWFPKMFGRRMNETLGKAHFWLTVPTTIAGFVTMHFLGMAGEQRHLYDPSAYKFLEPVQWLNVLISILLFIPGAAQFLFLWNFFHSMVAGERVGPNPWQATTLEWTTESPAPHLNWGAELPVAYRGPYDYRLNGAPDGYEPQAAAPSAAALVTS